MTGKDTLFDADGDGNGAPSSGSENGENGEAGEVERPFLGAFDDAAGISEAKRGPKIGRPKGAKNRKTEAFERYYTARGFKDPLVAMGEFLSTDPVQLLDWFERHETKRGSSKAMLAALPTLLEIVKAQLSAASDLAPYLHGKQPIRVKVEGEALPFLIIGAGTNQQEIAEKIIESRALSIGQKPVETPEEETSNINDLGDGE